MSFSKTIICGYLGKNPEAKTVGESKVTTFSVATSENYKNKQGEKVTDTEWFNVVVWGRLAEICEQYLRKGSLVLIEGKLKTRKWTDKEGVEKYRTELIGREMKMLGGKSEAQTPQPATQTEATAIEPQIGEGPDDLPF